MNFKTRIIIIVLIIMSALCIYITNAVFSSKPRLCQNNIVSITGKAVYDSSYSKNGNLTLVLKLKETLNSYGNRAEANGLVTLIWDRKCIIPFGCILTAEGYFSDNLFICNSLRISQKSRLCVIRERLIEFFESKILSDPPTEMQILEIMLLLGRSEDYFSPIQNKAASCGCIHVLALSGMHLNVLAKLCKIVFGKKKAGKIVSFILLSLFMFTAGPRPSLVRSYIMFLLAFLPSDERLCVAFVLQILLFPYHVVNLGFIYGYVSTAALIFLAPFIFKILETGCSRKLAYTCAAVLSVFVVNAPLQMFLNNIWYPVALIASPIISVMITMVMILSFMNLVFPLVFILEKAGNVLYSVLLSSLDFFCSFPTGLWPSYFVILAVLVCLLVFLRKRRL